MNFRSNRMWRLLGALTFLCLGTGNLSAGHITLQISAVPRPGDTEISCQVSILNQGDESAANVQAHVEFQGKRYSGQVMALLPVGQTYLGNYTIPIESLPPGRYVLVVIADYTDTNSYPFTALSVAGFPLREDVAPQIHGMAESIELSGSERLALRLKNQMDRTQAVHLKLVLPKEISADRLEQQFTLAPLQEKETWFQLRNFSALEGSTYQIYTLLDSVSDGKHTALTIPSAVKIVAVRSFFQKYKLYIVASAAVLALLFAGIQVYGFVSRRRRNRP